MKQFSQQEKIRLISQLYWDLNIDPNQLYKLLTGGTDLSRCHLNHRFSDDLDFFINDHKDFKDQCDNVVSRIRKSGLSTL
jgi:predicted nucleotidyltransferase component of viral defense system